MFSTEIVFVYTEASFGMCGWVLIGQVYFMFAITIPVVSLSLSLFLSLSLSPGVVLNGTYSLFGFFRVTVA